MDAVLHRRPDGRLGLRRRRKPVDLAPATEAVDVELEPDAAPAVALDEAIEWLDVGGEPFVFFRNLETGRANVAYRRATATTGLIVPADEPPPPAEPSIARRRLRHGSHASKPCEAALEGEGLAGESEADSLGETSTIDQHQADLGTETFERTATGPSSRTSSRRSPTCNAPFTSGSTAAPMAAARHAAPPSPTIGSWPCLRRISPRAPGRGGSSRPVT